MKFTKSAIAALTMPAGKTDHFEWDDATPGFGIRLRGDRRTWTAQIRVHGRTKRLAIGDVRQVELEAARTAAKRFFAEATLGQDPLKARAEARAKAANTVGAVVEKYLAARESVVRPNTYRHLNRYLNRYFASLHSSPIHSVTRRDVAIAVVGIAEQHGPVSAARARSTLSAFYGWALREGIAGESNPVEYTNTPSDEKPRERVLSPSEMRAIWQTCPDNDFGRITRLLFYTASRRGEIGLLEWSEVNFDRGMLVIPGEKMKGGRQHRLPLVPEAIEMLQSIPQRDGNPYVFGGRRGFTGFSYYHANMCKCLAATGDATESWTLHDIRRTVRSELGDLGVEPWVAETILAHKRAGIEGTYNWAKLERQIRQALLLWTDRLHAIVEDTDSIVVALRQPA